MASSVRSVDPVPLEDRRNSFRSRSPSRSRSPTPRSDYSRSPSMDRRRYDDRDSRGRSPPRNGRYRSRSRGRSFSRSVSRSRSRSRSRSYSRGRSWSRGRSRSWSRTRSATPPMRSTKIVVERLTKNINEDHLYEIFGQYGEIDDLDLPVNRQTGINRGTAYILYFNEEDAQAAISHMHESQLDGSVINVSIVLPRRKVSPSPPMARRGPRGPPANVRSNLAAAAAAGRGRRSPLPGRYGHRSDVYRPRSLSRSRSRSPLPPPSGSRRYRSRSRSPSYSSRSPSRSPPGRRGSRASRGWGRRYDDYSDRGRRRSPSRDSYDSYYRRSRSRTRSHSRSRSRDRDWDRR